MRLHWTAVVIALLGSISEPKAGESGPNLGRVMWSAFQCSIFAEIAEDKAEQERLFTTGYNAGNTFLERLNSGRATKQEREETPIGVSMLLAGPNKDFVIGRIFENAANDAYDSVVKQNANGFPLESSKWVTDAALKTQIAKNKYLQSNCVLIR